MFLNTVLSVYVPTKVFLTRQAKLFVQRTEGASGIEYAIIAAMVAVVIAGLSPAVQTEVTSIFTKITAGLKTA
ncbi:Flp family type IVb pilin [Pseudomonas sp. CCC3.1]|uniref:Flp family type IVb pilin n=1 Tax=Pseudomonas sp. CCC3.1 TaxID=3048607 RepID=UPI002AC8F6DF|nr:Flp family type IVb pilin [Pseudomonas sp. CCC3.1]MEB0205567.1 Flp family type IVb pilin [Pseudomonas sp. CCC3.1]WPX35556.1 Flp family type IVb pilin [Pseudomonas sp. CCC3.1]